MITKREQDAKKIDKLFSELEALGFDRRGWQLKRDALYFEYKKSRRLTKSEQVKFARLIRSCTLWERDGLLIADINRMGNVIGWHISRSLKYKPHKFLME